MALLFFIFYEIKKSNNKRKEFRTLIMCYKNQEDGIHFKW